MLLMTTSKKPLLLRMCKLKMDIHCSLFIDHNWIKSLHNHWILLVLSCALLCGSTSATEWEKVVNAARCRVRCLASLQMPPDMHLLRNKAKQSNVFSLCIDDAECRECLKPCSQPYVNLPLCKRICEEPGNPSCHRSCDFLHQMYTTHAGECPPQDALSVGESSCIEECVDDTDCSKDTKCCSNSCGHTCQIAWSPHKDMPSIPDQPLIREKAKGGSIDLRWNMPNSEMRQALLFIIEQRWNVGHEHSEMQMTSWQQIAQTTSTSISIKEITPGYWYQFRVSTVNRFGSRGVSEPTEPYRLSREPENPGAPRNMTEGDTIIKNNVIGVIIKWLPPKKSDLPVSRYKLFWSKKTSAVVPNEGEHRHVMDGDELQFVIPDLEPDTTYFVQVQAISQYGDQRLKSERASLYITTFPLPHSLQGGSDVDVRPLPKPEAVEALVVDEAYYQNGLLKANVTWQLPLQELVDDAHGIPEPADDSEGMEEAPVAKIHRVLVNWQPEVCIADELDNGLSQALSISTQENYFVIYDLRFDCRYNVKVQTVSQEGVTGSAVPLSFPTPRCQDAQIKGSNKPDCPTSDPRTPEPPVNLQYIIIIKKNNITASLVWTTPLSESPVTGYRVVWGQALIGELMEPLLDSTTAYTKVLSKHETNYSIPGLHEATTYVAKVQALSRAGDGTDASIYFTTPILSLKQIDPPYNRISDKNMHHPDPTLDQYHPYNDQHHPTASNDWGGSSGDRQGGGRGGAGGSSNHLGYSSSAASSVSSPSSQTLLHINTTPVRLMLYIALGLCAKYFVLHNHWEQR